jgi:hypothetical protein
MKKLTMFLIISILLQTIYYFLILKNNDYSGLKAYNWMSVISTAFFLGYYIHKSFFILRFDSTRNLQNVIVGVMIVIAMFSIIFYLTFFGNMFTAVYGVAVHQIDGYDLLRLYSDPTFGNFIEYHFIRLQASLIILYIFMDLILERDRFKVRRFIIYYKILTMIILIGSVVLLITNFGFFYYYNFLIISSLIFWLAVPIFYNVSSQFHHYYGVMVGWLITVIMFWYMISEFFSKYRMIVGYVFER